MHGGVAGVGGRPPPLCRSNGVTGKVPVASPVWLTSFRRAHVATTSTRCACTTCTRQSAKESVQKGVLKENLRTHGEAKISSVLQIKSRKICWELADHD